MTTKRRVVVETCEHTGIFPRKPGRSTTHGNASSETFPMNLPSTGEWRPAHRLATRLISQASRLELPELPPYPCAAARERPLPQAL
jgi:hypothetical protein